MTQEKPEESPILILCVFKKTCRTQTSAFQGISRKHRSIKMRVGYTYELFQLLNTWVWFISDTYCISACIFLHAAFRNCSMCQVNVYFEDRNKDGICHHFINTTFASF